MRTLPFLMLLVLGLPVGAQTLPCPMTYDQFEYAVPHIDLETCPGSLAGEGLFCRAAAGADAIHVFVFALDGDQCLLRVESVEEDRFVLVIE